MSELLSSDLLSARRAAVRSLDGHKASTDDEAARYLDERGFAPLFPLTGLDLPSLSDADAREGDGAWRWKEVLPAQGRCAYGKFLRGRGFFVSWRLFPAFYRLYGRSASPEEDYAAGLLGRPDLAVWQAIAQRGPVDSRVLWRDMKPVFGGSRPRFEAALTALQAGFQIMVSGGSLEGWSLHYWDLVERRAPPGTLAHLPTHEEALESLLYQYVANAVVCTARDVSLFLRRDVSLIRDLAARLVARALLAEVRLEGDPTARLALPI
jgi:hypothetical protein